MSLETRLRQELDRRAPSDVPDAAGLDDMRATVATRRARNRRIQVGMGALVLVAALGGGVALLNDSSDTGTIVAADGPGAGDDVTAQTSTPVADSATDATTAPTIAPEETKDLSGESAGVEATNDVSGTAADDSERVTAASGAVSVATRRSAVALAAGSGVLVVSDASGYTGLATRFIDDGLEAIGISSNDGLDWTEVELSGVPAGAAPTHLEADRNGLVALFSRFDATVQRNVTWIAYSDDGGTWDLGPELGGPDPVAVELAVGPTGVIAVGSGPFPSVWVAPREPGVSGTIEPAATLQEAGVVYGSAVLVDGFAIVASSTAFGTTAFVADGDVGASWTAHDVDAVTNDDTVVEVGSVGNELMLAGRLGEAAWTASSSDGGITWQRATLDSGAVGAMVMGGGSLGVLGLSDGIADVTLSDGTSLASASIEVDAPDRVSLLASSADRALLLADRDGTPTWIVVSR
ncbi:MAG: hypothetical protein ACR2P0_11610 [Acidimicrobiales bacterium]